MKFEAHTKDMIPMVKYGVTTQFATGLIALAWPSNFIISELAQCNLATQHILPLF